MNLSHGMADLASLGNADRDIDQVPLSLSLYVCVEGYNFWCGSSNLCQILMLCFSICTKKEDG